jgi:hypothetical protein
MCTRSDIYHKLFIDPSLPARTEPSLYNSSIDLGSGVGPLSDLGAGGEFRERIPERANQHLLRTMPGGVGDHGSKIGSLSLSQESQQLDWCSLEPSA